jgi:FlaA1/EpsC-like NDP-sugar epimerase
MISSDKAVRPTNIMGATKRFAECICSGYMSTGLKTNITIVRFGNVFGSSGSVIPKFEKQISAGGPLTVTDKRVTRYFMSINEAAKLVIQASAIDDNGKVYVLDMGKPHKIIELAIKIAGLNGLQTHFQNQTPVTEDSIEIVFTGLRPGEKLHEELFHKGKPIKTIHPDIMCMQEVPIDNRKLSADLNHLKSAVSLQNTVKVREILESSFLDYHPKRRSRSANI